MLHDVLGSGGSSALLANAVNALGEGDTTGARQCTAARALEDKAKRFIASTLLARMISHEQFWAQWNCGQLTLELGMCAFTV